MKTVGIVIESWKLSIFKKHLTDAGFAYKKHPGPIPGALLLKVKTTEVHELHRVTQNATNAAAMVKHRKMH